MRYNQKEWNVKENGIDTGVFDTTRMAFKLARVAIEETLDDEMEDLKIKGLIDMTMGVCEDALRLGEQMVAMLNVLNQQNQEMMAKMLRIEAKVG